MEYINYLQRLVFDVSCELYCPYIVSVSLASQPVSQSPLDNLRKDTINQLSSGYASCGQWVYCNCCIVSESERLRHFLGIRIGSSWEHLRQLVILIQWCAANKNLLILAQNSL